MTQIAIPNGFELIYFSWDRLKPFPGGAGGFTNVDLAPACAAFPAAMPRAVERSPGEEDVERWDGLS